MTLTNIEPDRSRLPSNHPGYVPDGPGMGAGVNNLPDIRIRPNLSTPSGDANTGKQILKQDPDVPREVLFSGEIRASNMDENPQVFAKSLASVIQDLMKLLVQSNAELMTTQQIAGLTSLQNMLEAFDAKLKAMEAEKNSTYAAACKQAIGQIVGGSVQGAMAIGGGILGGMGLKEAKSVKPEFAGSPDNLIITNQHEINTAGKGWEIASGTLTQFGMGANSAISGAYSLAAAKDNMDATDARKDQAIAEKTMQLWEKSGENITNMIKTLQQETNNTISNILNMLQAQASTEGTIARG